MSADETKTLIRVAFLSFVLGSLIVTLLLIPGRAPDLNGRAARQATPPAVLAAATGIATPVLTAVLPARPTPQPTTPVAPAPGATAHPLATLAATEAATVTVVGTTVVPSPPPPTVAPSTTTSLVDGVVLPGRFEVEDYKVGGEGVGYHDATPGNSGGVYRADDVDIEPCADGAPCYNVGWITAGEWLAYDVHVAHRGRYTFMIRAASPRRDARLHLEVNGVDVTGPLQVPQTGGYQLWTDVVSRAVALAAGTYELRVVAETDSLNWNYVVVTGNDSPTPSRTPTQ